MRLAFTILTLLAFAGCNKARAASTAADNCYVVKFVSAVTPAPVCAIECYLPRGRESVLSATPVSCTWYGHRVFVR